MTESEWLACEDPEPMLELLRTRASQRKLILFCKEWYLASGKTDWMRKADPAWEVAERFAEGMASVSELNTHWLAPNATSRASWPQRPLEWAISVTSPDYPANLGFRDVPPQGHALLPLASSLLREIFGNPFRPVAFSSEWCTDTALTLARQMYDSRDFVAMPILSDALQDAGCDNEDILNHCHGPGPHVRGCWVLDLVLDKE